MADSESNVGDNVVIGKDPREQELDRKIAQMRERNQQIEKRHQLREADRRQAELSGCAVQLRQTSTSPIAHLNDRDENDESYANEAPRSQAPRSQKSKPVRDEQVIHRVNAKQRLGTQSVSDEVTSNGQPRQSALNARRQLTQSKDDPPPDPVNRFLADPRRNNETDAPQDDLVSSRGQRSQRNHRNYGGENFENVQRTIESQKKTQHRPQSNQSKTDYQLSTTGSERRQYEMWKMERNKVDSDRIQRQKQADGNWKREWDAEKKEPQLSPQSSSAPPSSQTPASRSSGSTNREQRPSDAAAVSSSSGVQGRGRGRGRLRQNQDQSLPIDVGRQYYVETPSNEVLPSTGDRPPPGLPSSAEVINLRLMSETRKPRPISSASHDSIDEVPAGLPSSRELFNLPPAGLPSSEEVLKISPSSSKNARGFQPSFERTVVKDGSERLVINVNVGSSGKNLQSKSPKIGSGRLGKVDNASSRKSGSQVQGNLNKRREGRKTEGDAVMIGMAVIRTPGDEPESTTVRKGILKQSPKAYSNAEQVDVDEELVVDWNKEVAEAERRKALEMKKEDVQFLSQTIDQPKKPSEVGSEDKVAENASQRGLRMEEVRIDKDEGVEDDEEWEDVDEDEHDLHDNSSESFEQFIKENTLKLDIECPPHVWSPEQANGSLTPGSDGSFMKTPTGHVHIIDWGAEMEAHSDTEISPDCSIKEEH